MVDRVEERVPLARFTTIGTGGPARWFARPETIRSEEHTSELQSRLHLVCRLLLEKKKRKHELSQEQAVVARAPRCAQYHLRAGGRARSPGDPARTWRRSHKALTPHSAHCIHRPAL